MNAEELYRKSKLNKISVLLAVATELDLEAEPLFFDCCTARLAELYNGIGPQKFDAFGVMDLNERAQELLGLATRQALTKILAHYEPAALIHDWDCHYLPKTDEGFERASDRFRRNCDKIAQGLAKAEIDSKSIPFWRRWLFCEGWLVETAIYSKHRAVASIMYRAVHSDTGKVAYMQG